MFLIKSLYYYGKRLRVTMKIFIIHRNSSLFCDQVCKSVFKANVQFYREKSIPNLLQFSGEIDGF